MLPTQGYFKEVECPYYVFTIKGSCNRPHCHFRHSRRDHDYDFSEPPVVEDPVPDQNELKDDGDGTPEDSEEEIENQEDNQESSNDNDQNINQDHEKQEILQPNNEEDEGGGLESEEEEEEQPPEQEIDDGDEFDIEENLLRFKKALMNAIKKVIETYHKIFCKNINTKDFNQLIDEFIKNLINYEEVEAAEFKKVTYNPTPIIELKRQEKRIKTQLPYIPECVKATNQPIVNEALDIDSDLKFLEDLIQNDSLFSNTDSSHENCEQATESKETNKNQKENSSRKDKKEEVKEKEKSSRDKDRHKKSHSKSSHDLSSSSKDKDKDSKSSSSKSSSSSKEKHKSSSESSTHKQSSSSSKDAKSQSSGNSHHSKSSSSSSKHSSSHKRSRSKSRSQSHSDENKHKKSKHSSSSGSSSHHKGKSKSESAPIVISSESSEDDQDNSYDIYNNMDLDDDTNDNGENLVANDNTKEKPSDKHKGSEEENYDEPEYIRKKKKQRIAHVDIFGIPSNPQPVSNRAKTLNPNERFKQIQEKYKGLNRPAQAQSSSNSGDVKIPPVPNVSSLLTAKKTLTQPPSLNINKNSLLMNDILKRTELKKTIAQTSKKNNRVAHVPSTGSTVTKPLIQVDATGTRIPLVVRQTCLDRIFALYSKYIPPDLASSRARQVESETYDKCHATKSYQNSIANSILRIRKEQSGFFMGSKSEVR
ncbi:hypothetical protein WDU94_015156 [Cyamophila willieti]